MRIPSLLSKIYVSISLLACLNTMTHAQNLEVLAEYAVAFIGQDITNASDQASYLGATENALKLSQTLSIDVEIRDYTPQASIGENQITALAKAYAANVDAIIISPDFKTDLEPSLNFAAKHDYPIVFIGSAPKDNSALANIIVDEVATGKRMAERLLEQLPSNARAAILIDEPMSPAIKARLSGVRGVLGFRKIEKVVSTPPSYEAAVNTLLGEEANDTNDLISGWVLLSDWPLRGMPLLPWQPGRKPAVAYLTSPTSLNFLENNYVPVFITHPYYSWGEQSVEIVIKKLFQNDSPQSQIIFSEALDVDRYNLMTYQEAWKNWLR
jgi:ABC-type sugar transport system substrate-binding protein